MRFDQNDGTPIFESQSEAAEERENGDLTAVEQEAAREVEEAMKEGWDAETLAAEPVIAHGQADDLHVQDHAGARRLYLSRTGTAGGEPFENTVTIERLREGLWQLVAKYDGGELIPEKCGSCGEEMLTDRSCDNCGWSPDGGERGKFVVEINPGNAAMQTAADVGGVLRKLADKLTDPESLEWTGEGPILDLNGNTVGRYTFEDQNG